MGDNSVPSGHSSLSTLSMRPISRNLTTLIGPYLSPRRLGSSMRGSFCVGVTNTSSGAGAPSWTVPLRLKVSSSRRSCGTSGMSVAVVQVLRAAVYDKICKYSSLARRHRGAGAGLIALSYVGRGFKEANEPPNRKTAIKCDLVRGGEYAGYVVADVPTCDAVPLSTGQEESCEVLFGLHPFPPWHWGLLKCEFSRRSHAPRLKGVKKKEYTVPEFWRLVTCIKEKKRSLFVQTFTPR